MKRRGKIVRVSPLFAELVREESINTGLEGTVLTDVLAAQIRLKGGILSSGENGIKKVDIKKKVRKQTWNLLEDL